MACATDGPPMTQPLLLLDLNDDCLFAIMRWLAIGDVAAVAGSCARLQCIARQLFAIRGTDKCPNLCRLQTQAEHAQQGVEQYLHNFHDLIDEINCDAADYAIDRLLRRRPTDAALSDTIFGHIARYCGGRGAVRTLRLKWAHLSADTIRRARPFFAQLTELTLDNCPSTDAILAAAAEGGSIGALNVCGTLLDHGLEQRFGRLHTFRFDYYRHAASRGYWNVAGKARRTDTLERFLLGHARLRRLAVSSAQSFNYAVIGRLRHLRDLTITSLADGGRNVFEFRSIDGEEPATQWHLPRLERLAVRAPNAAAAAALLGLVAMRDSVRCLELQPCALDGRLVEQLNGYRRLRVLKVSLGADACAAELQRLDIALDEMVVITNARSFDSQCLLTLVRRLQTLRTFRLVQSREPTTPALDEALLEAIDRCCRGRNAKLKLELYTAGRSGGGAASCDRYKSGAFVEVTVKDLKQFPLSMQF